jgi:hypothetical protein
MDDELLEHRVVYIVLLPFRHRVELEDVCELHGRGWGWAG